MKTKALVCGLVLAAFALHPYAQQRNQNERVSPVREPTPGLVPTNHPRLPRDLSLLWLAPGRGPGAPPASSRELATSLKLVEKGEYAKALSMLSQPAVQEGSLRHYAAFYAGVVEQELGRHADARRTLRELQDEQPIGYLSEAAALAEAASDEALNDYRAAVEIYARLSHQKTVAGIDDILMRLGTAAKAAGELRQADEAFARVYYEFPLGEFADKAGAELAARSIAPGGGRDALELGRAERLFSARQYAAARSAFAKVKGAARSDDHELVDLRIAECDYFLKRYGAAREGLRPWVSKASRQSEALYFHAITMRAIGDRATYERTLRRIVDEFPAERWAEEALNHLATDRVRGDNDAQADAVFRELFAKYPRSAYSERAAWKIGWRSYRAGAYEESAQFFERAAAHFPRSDYRPAWLYWSGRAHEALGEHTLAVERHTLVTADYLNSYYGRLAAARLNGRRAPPRGMADAAPPALPLPPNEPLVRALLDIDAYDLALNELRFAERTWGDSPALQATEAWIFRQQGQTQSGTERFNLLRGSMTVIKRAYPQYMAAGGEELPRDVLSMIFPLDYWDLIRKHAAIQKLDPFLVAALVAQESTFVRDIRSAANAYGLMQLIPSTARQYARKLKLPYSAGLLTNAEANVRMGTAYLADKIREFDDLHLALASYNAGERTVRRWLAERPGLTDREEFIDDIPYPETQNYVKKVLGTAEDYRRLYGQ